MYEEEYYSSLLFKKESYNVEKKIETAYFYKY